MSDTVLLLLLIVVGPILWMSGILRAVSVSSLGHETARGIVLVAPLVYTTLAAIAIVLVLDGPVPVGYHPVVLSTLVLGGALYFVDTAAMTRLSANGRSAGSYSVGLGSLSILGCIPEEILYRWGLYVVLVGIDPRLFVAVSAIVFGLHHYKPNDRLSVLLKTINGCVYAALFLWTGSLLAPILCHTAYNASFLVVAVVSGR